MFVLQVGDEGYDEYTRYQPPRKQPGGGGGRYEVSRPSLRALQSGMKAKFLTVYTNGEKYIYDKPVQISFKLKTYPKLNSLLDEIARVKERVNKTLVRYLYKWPSCEPVLDVQDIHEDDETFIYICSDTKKIFKRGRYGDMDYAGPGGGGPANGSGRNSYDSRYANRSTKVSPTAMRSNGSMNARRGEPIMITVISNTVRSSKQTYFFDPRSNQPFEEILRSITDMVEMDYPPCKALYSTSPPYKKVRHMYLYNSTVGILI